MMRRGRAAGAAVAWVMVATLHGTWATAQEPVTIGVSTSIVRSVNGTAAGNVRSLKERDGVYFLEAITTGEKSAAQFRFLDESILTMGASAAVTIDSFVFDVDPSKQKAVVDMSSGVLRFVSGNMSSAAYDIRTPTAILGVRGTVFALVVEADGATTVLVEDGEVQFSNIAGAAVTVTRGNASRVGANGEAPSPPGPPGAASAAAVVSMTTVVATTTTPAVAVPEITVTSVAALAPVAADLASGISSASPGGQGK